MMPDQPQHKSKLIASMDRISTLVASVSRSMRLASTNGTRTATTRVAASTSGSTRKPTRRAAGRAGIVAASVSGAAVIASASALLWIDHRRLADHLVSGLAGVDPAYRHVH